MKVLVATDKPFAKVAVDGIRKEIEAAGYELALLEKYGEKTKLLEAVADADAIIIRSDIIDAEVLGSARCRQATEDCGTCRCWLRQRGFGSRYGSQRMRDEHAGPELQRRG